MSEVLTSGRLQVNYFTMGDGDRLVLCFHGFGRSAHDFDLFRPLVEPDEKWVCIYLFGHGKSHFPTEEAVRKPLEPEEWKVLIADLLLKFNGDRFSLIGYSMGGRIAMMTCLSFAHRVDRLLLLAPDGFKKNALYQFASGTAFGRMVYRFFMRHSGILFFLAKSFERIGLITKKLHRFVISNLDTAEKRERVYHVWLVYRKMFPDQRKLAKEIRGHQCRIIMVFGQYDTIIPVRLGERFSRSVLKNPNVLHVARLGHGLMQPGLIPYLRERMLWP